MTLTVEKVLAMSEAEVKDLTEFEVYGDIFNNKDISREDKMKVLGRTSASYLVDHPIHDGDFMLEPWDIPQPYNHYVVIQPDEVQDKVGSIVLPGQSKGYEEFKRRQGRIVALGLGAFKDRDDMETPWPGIRPKVGERVAFYNVNVEKVPVNGVSLFFMSDINVKVKLSPNTKMVNWYSDDHLRAKNAEIDIMTKGDE